MMFEVIQTITQINQSGCAKVLVITADEKENITFVQGCDRDYNNWLESYN